jgi:[CysO sulfur-carrier protein]-S-L-cysteine hydrolase
MIQIEKQVLENIIDHAKRELPNEACGYLAGTEDTVIKSFELTNIDKSPDHFSFDPKEQLQTLNQARQLRLNLTANYHSHPSTPARPSEEDIRLAYDKNISYFIVSLQNDTPVIKAFEFDSNGNLVEAQLKII